MGENRGEKETGETLASRRGFVIYSLSVHTTYTFGDGLL